MADWKFGAALLAAIVATAPSAAPAQVANADVRPWIARQVLPQIQLLSTPEDYFGPAVGNVTIIEQTDGFVLIDSGLTYGNGRSIVDFIRSRSTKPVKAIAISHWHNDHPQGVAAIREAWPNVRIIATPQTEAGMLGPEAVAVGYRPDPRMTSEMKKLVDGAKEGAQKLLADPATPPDRRQRVEKSLADFDLFFAGYPGTYIVPPTETFERELTLDDREMPVRLLHLGRANTDGDLVAWLPRQKVVVTGDIVVSPIQYGFGSYPSDWIATIGRLKALGATTLIPGHGAPQSDNAYLDTLVKAIEAVREQVGPLAKAGMPLDEVKKKVDFTKAAELFGTTPRIKANAQSLFFEPMVSNAYKEALGQPIIQGEGNPKPEYSHTPPKPSSKKHKT